MLRLQFCWKDDSIYFVSENHHPQGKGGCVGGEVVAPPSNPAPASSLHPLLWYSDSPSSSFSGVIAAAPAGVST